MLLLNAHLIPKLYDSNSKVHFRSGVSNCDPRVVIGSRISEKKFSPFLMAEILRLNKAKIVILRKWLQRDSSSRNVTLLF